MGYSCRYCDFYTRGTVEDLHNHMRGFHGLDIGRNPQDGGKDGRQRDFAHGNWHGKRDQFRCNLCDRVGGVGGRKFESAQAFHDHIKAKHSG